MKITHKSTEVSATLTADARVAPHTSDAPPSSPRRRVRFDASAPWAPKLTELMARAGAPPTVIASRPLDRPALFPGRGSSPGSSGSFALAPLVVAIVGARRACHEALGFARAAAAAIARAGRVVASGGAFGVDAAAHEGALDVGGITWCVAATGPDRVFPEGHADLFARIEASPGAMVWTREEGTETSRGHFLVRNSVLVALADAVLIVQAGAQSGSLHTARRAKESGCPILVARPPAWGEGFDGSRALIRDRVGEPVESLEHLMAVLELVSNGADDDPKQARQLELNLSTPQAQILSKVTQSPQHMDEIAHSAGLRAGEAATLLLTLALENVVVEGPSGFFRRQQLL